MIPIQIITEATQQIVSRAANQLTSSNFKIYGFEEPVTERGPTMLASFLLSGRGCGREWDAWQRRPK